jgi:hypothetical protein
VQSAGPSPFDLSQVSFLVNTQLSTAASRRDRASQLSSPLNNDDDDVDLFE